MSLNQQQLDQRGWLPRVLSTFENPFCRSIHEYIESLKEKRRNSEMKKTVVLSLILVLILSVGAMAAPNDVAPGLDPGIGSIKGDKSISAQADVTVKIDEYARVWFEQNKLFQKSLLGRPGLYVSNMDTVYEHAEAYFRDRGKLESFYWPEADEDWVSKEEGHAVGSAYFRVESNCDATVTVAFDWYENEGMESDLVLFVYNGDSGRAVNNGWYDSFATVDETLEFLHRFESKEFGKAYKIGGAVFIDYISQQRAGEYKGFITITVSAAPTAL